MQGVFIDNGCVAKYSVAEYDNAVYWLSRGRHGQGYALAGSGYQVTRVSTFAIEAELTTYARLDDAVGMVWQVGGHAFYVLSFPAADKTWVYDITTQTWAELVWLDGNGTEHRHRAACAWLVNGTPVIGDWQNGNLYALDLAAFTDAGAPIKRQRAFSHMVADGERVFYKQFLADMQTGTAGGTTADVLGAPVSWADRELRVSLDWSNDRGQSFGNAVEQGIGSAGEYITSVQFQRLGMARDRVFRLTWSGAAPTALQGAWVDVQKAMS
jgi:hypothetical protein